jgi:ABC-type bacteriocin/lantibiotic exporter with double-glycine peptidase domain
VQIGTLASVIGFIALSQPWLGLLALAVVVPQAAIVVGIQNRINRNVRARVQSLRDASDRISKSDLARVEDELMADFRDVFETRRRIFFLKLSSKFALAAISALGKVGILFLGGWLVLDGRSDVGTVVASLTGLTRIEGPLARPDELLPHHRHGAGEVRDAGPRDRPAAVGWRMTGSGRAKAGRPEECQRVFRRPKTR